MSTCTNTAINTELVAVYGTLKQGHGNNRLLSSSEFMGAEQIKGFKMFSAGGFPVVFHSEDSKDEISVEVFMVEQSTLQGDLDRLEGHPRWYRRELIDVSIGKAWIYVMQDQAYARPERLIKTGVF